MEDIMNDNMQYEDNDVMEGKEIKHRFGLWSSNTQEGKFIYSRQCVKCGYIEKIDSSSKVFTIEKELLKQEKYAIKTDTFCNADDELLDDEAILIFLLTTVDCHSYMDIDKIMNRIRAAKGGYIELENKAQDRMK